MKKNFNIFSVTTCSDCVERLENTKDLFTDEYQQSTKPDDNSCLSFHSQLAVTCVQLSATKTRVVVVSVCSFSLLYGGAAIFVINVIRSIPSLPFDYTEKFMHVAYTFFRIINQHRRTTSFQCLQKRNKFFPVHTPLVYIFHSYRAPELHRQKPLGSFSELVKPSLQIDNFLIRQQDILAKCRTCFRQRRLFSYKLWVFGELQGGSGGRQVN